MYYNVQIGKRNIAFTYEFSSEIKLGSFCLVELGNKTVEGIVVEKLKSVKEGFKIKPIIKVLDRCLDEKLFMLMQWIHRYYLEPYGNLLSIITPIEITKDFDDIKIKENKKIESVILNEEQQKVLNDIENSEDKIHLINGVTGSGKTEIYMALIKNALKENGSSIILVPEISLTPQLSKKLEEVFSCSVAVWHSKLKPKEKMIYYNNISSGKTKVVLGARSAIFCNLKNLRYIIIDEEHENTYKQEDAPRYHVKNVAIKRAFIENAKLILASATPSFETMYQVKSGHIKEHILKKRYNNAKMPDFELVDIKSEKDLLSEKLLQEINSRIENKEQTIILLNRKAYSIYVECISCKMKMECKDCSSKLIYYKKKNILKCNTCGNTYKDIIKCSSCGSDKLKKVGIGTEKLEEKLKEIFDEDRILRMDSDSMSSKTKIDKAYNDFLDKKYDILVGTQILAKGFHFPDVTLVVVINADQMLSYPDYKVNERTYQLITQAAGRAGREAKKGKVIIQTIDKDQKVLEAVVNNDYDLIYEEEMDIRKRLKYPPYSKHIKILLTDTKEDRLNKVSNEIHRQLVSSLNDEAKIYPVSTELIYKIAKRYRNNINLLFDRENEVMVKRKIRKILANNTQNNTRILVDVDPSSML